MTFGKKRLTKTREAYRRKWNSKKVKMPNNEKKEKNDGIWVICEEMKISTKCHDMIWGESGC
jgi:hypothetical protein